MFLYYIIALLSVLLYLHGFFPFPSRPTSRTSSWNLTTAKPIYQKAVIIVIDALRLDFITPDSTPFISRTFKQTGCFTQLKVETPTVTLPRIKALTTGNVPQFVDIILNLASPTKLEDSLIHRAYAQKKDIVFYGDDIWLKLFPSHFKRSEGTSSFFVNDFKEVDDNVTRNVKQEINRTDWDLMILHYLGLDHIGHVYGPKSPLIVKKLDEMDKVVDEIYNKLKETLIIITGDHGMRDSGGHGGSTFPETNVPLIILGMSCTNDTFAQIDIPANLAVLLGLEIPATSIGQLQFSLLGRQLSLPEYLEALKYNSFFLNGKMNLCEENIITAKRFHELFLINKNTDLGNGAVKLYQDCTKKISERLLKTSVQQNVGSLLIACLMLVSVMAKILQNFCEIHAIVPPALEQFLMFIILVLQFQDLSVYVSNLLVVITLIVCLQNILHFNLKHLTAIKSLSFVIFVSALNPLTFFSSSFLEEEHQFWYFFASTFILLQVVHKHKSWFFIFIALRFLRTINQVGDKWASCPDLVDWLIKEDNHLILKSIFATALILSGYANYVLLKSKSSVIIDVFVLISIYMYRMVLNENIVLAQSLWLVIFLKLVYCQTKNFGFLTVWVLLINLLIKPYNSILIPICMYASQEFHKLLKHDNLVMAHWWMGNLLFFAQGHDNSLASVDISSGYVGLREYVPLLVVLQVLCHTYALPVLSHLLLFQNKRICTAKYLSLFVLLRLYTVVTVFIVTFVHRHHLFIWSVFAPKIFVESSHFGFLFIELCCYYLNFYMNKCFS